MKKMNDNILKITYVFIGLFAILAVYLVIYILTDGREDINNPYNKRQELLEKKVLRGNIYSNDMDILAETIIDEEGNEKRNYPYDELFCHIIGNRYDTGSYGLELSYKFDLLSYNQSIVDELLADFNEKKLQGNSIITTLDVDLQDACYEALGKYEGAVVIMDAVTGDILSMVSKPDYNPNNISGIWDDIKNDKKGVLLNRATQGLYTPGSIFKLFVLGEYIRSYNETYDEYLYTCKGKINYSDFSLKCSNGKAHGKLDLSEAFAKSCNCSFADIGLKTDTDSLKAYCNNKLFNSNLPLEIPYSKSSYVLNVYDSEFMKIQTYIGQGETLVTPIHMCMVMSSIVNDGILMKPRIVSKIIDKKGNTIENTDISQYGSLYTKNEADLLKKYLGEVVNSGTATKLKNDKADVYGKTGTAQIDSNGLANSWFVGGIETQDKKLAISVVIEKVDDNTSPAVSVTKDIIKTLD